MHSSPFPQPCFTLPQSLVWEYYTTTQQNVPYCTFPPEVSRDILFPSPVSMSPCGSPGQFWTPEKELSQIAAKTQDTWERMMKKMDDQSKEIKELTKRVNENQSLSKEKFQLIGTKQVTLFLPSISHTVHRCKDGKGSESTSDSH